ncbi:MAG: AAA family ATPase [Candidatus Latescibacteria bacterium]|nr:AAA family ATPase [Candidatus Latescibacterota bacterium]
MTRRRLPIGIQTFRKIREENCYYVGKTAYIQRLIDEGTHYFLSRPRRFGKSLFLDTLKELFEGNEPLFKGLYIHDRWDWSVRHPVIRLSFGSGNFKESGDLQANLLDQLAAIERRTGVVVEAETVPGHFAYLIEALHDRAGQPVVVLVDEYDKPILDALEVPEVARANRDFLRGLYATIKDSDAYIKFTFLTGVSKFSTGSLFSGLNNLTDITIDPHYSAICGYTDADLDTVFAPELPGLDRNEIHRWYNGYNWLGEDKIYNPFDILLLFDKRQFGAYWFETSTPTFLIRTLVDRGVSSIDLDDILGSDDLLSAFDVDHIATEALLFQTGYLTIRHTEPRGSRTYYRLGYPNQEVRQSLNESLLNHLTGNPTQQVRPPATTD